MGRSSKKVVAETELRLLAYIKQQGAQHKRPTSLSLARMTRDLHISVTRIRFARGRLEQEGSLKVIARTAEDGGCLANGYKITPAGLKRLESAEADASE